MSFSTHKKMNNINSSCHPSLKFLPSYVKALDILAFSFVSYVNKMSLTACLGAQSINMYLTWRSLDVSLSGRLITFRFVNTELWCGCLFYSIISECVCSFIFFFPPDSNVLSAFMFFIFNNVPSVLIMMYPLGQNFYQRYVCFR